MMGIDNKEYSANYKAFFQLGLMMFLTIFTQIIMLVKTSILASKFGVSVEMDAFNFANSIGTFIYSFIGAGITTVLIPNLVNKDRDKGINIFISVLYSIAFIILIVVQLFKVTIVTELSSGSKEFIALTCNIMFITLITQYINSFTGTTDAIFQCSGKFNIPKLVTLSTSILLVILLIKMPNLSIYKYAKYILITTIINIILQIYLSIKKCGYFFSYKIDLKNYEFKRMIKTFLPTVLGAGVYQISLLIDSLISFNLGAGEISKLTYANTIIGMINGVILTNIITYFYPKISKSIGKDGGQRKLFDLSIIINSILLLIVLGFIIVGREGIMILYERGNFTSLTTGVVYMYTLIYIIGLPINGFRDLIYRYFYATGDTITPFKNGLVVSCFNIFISIFLSKYIGVYGIIWGTVIASYISLAMILFKFSKKFDFHYSKKNLLVENSKLIISVVVTILIIKMIRNVVPKFNSIINLILYGSLSILIYILIIYILKSKIFKLKIEE